jgi:hypothetical protein
MEIRITLEDPDETECLSDRATDLGLTLDEFILQIIRQKAQEILRNIYHHVSLSVDIATLKSRMGDYTAMKEATGIIAEKIQKQETGAVNLDLEIERRKI